MLLNRYTKEFVRPPHPGAKHLRCFAHLDDNISEVLPYLHTALKGHQYFPDIPSLTLKYQDRLITLYPLEIHINIVKDAEEAEAMLSRLQQIINNTWRHKDTIRPSWETIRTPLMLPVLKLLPRTNCRQCGETTCLVFAQRVAAGEKLPSDCPSIAPVSKSELEEYLKLFFQDSCQHHLTEEP